MLFPGNEANSFDCEISVACQVGWITSRTDRPTATVTRTDGDTHGRDRQCDINVWSDGCIDQQQQKHMMLWGE